MTKRIAIYLAGIGILTHCSTASAQNTPVSQPVRISIAPGLSTPGKADTQTTSHFSLNILGGSTGSVNGVEIGSLFNIDKHNVQVVQVAGLFNMVGGYAKGVQAAGLYNIIKGPLQGIQAAGLTNYAGKNVHGIQAGGLHNTALGNVTGIQAGGISNFARQNVKGIQVAGIANITNREMKGFQVAGIVNYAKHIKGLQVGLINIAETSDGYSIGLINIVTKGYHKLSLYANEVLNTNIAFKSGNRKLYNILLAGVNAGNDKKVFTYGYGIGHEITFGKMFSINPEITSQYLYLGNWHYLNLLNKVTVQFNIQLTKGVSLFAGPSFAAYYSDQVSPVKGYKFRIPGENYHVFELWNDNVTGWIGWNAGISFF